MTKRILSFIVATALLLSCFVLPVVAEGEGSVTITSGDPNAEYILLNDPVSPEDTEKRVPVVKYDKSKIIISVTLPNNEGTYTGAVSNFNCPGWSVDVYKSQTLGKVGYEVALNKSDNSIPAIFSGLYEATPTDYIVDDLQVVNAPYVQELNMASGVTVFPYPDVELRVKLHGETEYRVINNTDNYAGWDVLTGCTEQLLNPDTGASTLVANHDYTISCNFMNKLFSYTLHVINDPSKIPVGPIPSEQTGSDYTLETPSKTVFIGDNTVDNFSFRNAFAQVYRYIDIKNYDNFKVSVDGTEYNELPSSSELGVGTHQVRFFFGDSWVNGTLAYIVKANPIKKIEVVNDLKNPFVIQGDSKSSLSLAGLKVKVYLEDSYAKSINLQHNDITFYVADGCSALPFSSVDFEGLDTSVIGTQSVSIVIAGVRADKKANIRVIKDPIKKLEILDVKTKKAYTGATIRLTDNIQKIRVTYDPAYASSLGLDTVVTYEADDDFGISYIDIPGCRYAYGLTVVGDDASNTLFCDTEGENTIDVTLTKNGGNTPLCTPAQYTITVEDNPIDSIEVSHMPTYTEYTQGCGTYEFVKDGLVVNLLNGEGTVVGALSKANNWTFNGISLYNDAREVMYTQEGVGGLNAPGNYMVTLTYGEARTQLQTKIVPNNYTKLEVLSNPTVTEFSGIYKPSFLGTKIRLTKKDGSYKDYTITDDMAYNYTILKYSDCDYYSAQFILSPTLPYLYVDTVDYDYNEDTNEYLPRYISNGDYIFTLGNKVKTTFSKNNFLFKDKTVASYDIKIPTLLKSLHSDAPASGEILIKYANGTNDEFKGDLIRNGGFGDGDGVEVNLDGTYVYYDIGMFNLFKTTSKGVVAITSRIYDNVNLPLAASISLGGLLLKIDPNTGVASKAVVSVDGQIDGSTVLISDMDNATMLGIDSLTTEKDSTIEFDITSAGNGDEINGVTFKTGQLRMINSVVQNNQLISSATMALGDSSVSFDGDALENITGQSDNSVTLSSEVGGADELDEKQKEALAKGSDVENVVDLNLSADGEEIHDLGGEAKISLNVEAPSDGEDLAAYYYNEKAAEWEPVEGSFNPKTNEFDMNTNHFSTYVIVKVPKSSSVSAEKIANTLDENSITASSILLVASVAAFVTLRKKENEE